MKLVPLSGKRGAGKFAMVSDHDYHHVMAAGPWFLDAEGYARRNTPHPDGGRRKNGFGKRWTQQFLHQFLGQPGELYDHVDFDRLNNLRSNLRLATRAQNNQNLRSYRGSTSSYRGVSFQASSGKWHAQVKVDGVRLLNKLFDKEEDAAASAAECRRLHMPFSSEAGAA